MIIHIKYEDIPQKLHINVAGVESMSSRAFIIEALEAEYLELVAFCSDGILAKSISLTYGENMQKNE